MPWHDTRLWVEVSWVGFVMGEAETTPHLGTGENLKKNQPAGYHIIKNITSTLSPRESWSSKRNLDVLYNMLAKSRCIFLEFKWWFPVGYNNPTVTSHLQQSKKKLLLCPACKTSGGPSGACGCGGGCGQLHPREKSCWHLCLNPFH